MAVSWGIKNFIMRYRYVMGRTNKIKAALAVKGGPDSGTAPANPPDRASIGSKTKITIKIA
jgi:hypothetical protein